ncbi:MAG: YbaB/EbfC family nucleoid-associated protein [Anaerolineae bacterium]|nr:YbaB/EbfC family nucleoid-associated protein [Anaerolineae bacterium]
MLQQVQQIQADMAAAQEAMGDEEFEVTVGGGAVTIVITGHQEVREVRINPDIIDTEEEEWLEDLQDLIVAAVNQAIKHSQDKVAERMQAIAGPLAGMMGDMGMGGLLGL